MGSPLDWVQIPLWTIRTLAVPDTSGLTSGSDSSMDDKDKYLSPLNVILAVCSDSSMDDKDAPHYRIIAGYVDFRFLYGR